jgi:hypothetical protein
VRRPNLPVRVEKNGGDVHTCDSVGDGVIDPIDEGDSTTA